ncbi:hypothetical protein KAFR_0H01240 [Kazachstania africana CBS 2517]|uniref:Endoplasmic reticulum lectin n=1 Tax=Kazachstania africana (strain ATCC 22294 / BCRC 22015 / CBS 2517 / CECT 1963 / NBRC 1671 / NRRL Y-8276) TaxID=1071382 RepID=H2AYX8_KAZAF|nr:hypothetical protein KAFR_0H01240 [Kazachstania africana CBS 2517]CCF59534.1 hypothetical protein KAFR_0H01240 [Kazachstania africana CBS 2517]
MQVKHTFLTSLLLSLRLVRGILVPIEDPNAGDKYKIDYVDGNEWKNLKSNGTFMSTQNLFSFGNNDECLIPKQSSLTDEEELPKNSEKLQQALRDTLKEGVEVLSDVLDDKCLVYNSGFWIYRYCSGGDFIQFHGDIDKIESLETLLYTLGRSSTSKKEREFQLLYDDVGYYISEVIRFGDECDVTGYPRVIEVQYVCGPINTVPSIQWVRETKICHYEAQIAVPELCNFELLSKNEDSKTASTIMCLKDAAEDKVNTKDVIDMITAYSPKFLGHGVYLLEPARENEMWALMYSDDINNEDNGKVSRHVYENFGNAINKLIAQGLLKAPDGSPMQSGDQYAWISDIFDLEGNRVQKLRFAIADSRQGELVIRNNLTSPLDSNFEYYHKNNNFENLVGRRKIDSDKKSKKIDAIEKVAVHISPELEVEILASKGEARNVIVINDLFFEDGLTQDEANELLKKIFDSAQFEDIMKAFDIQQGEEYEIEAFLATQFDTDDLLNGKVMVDFFMDDKQLGKIEEELTGNGNESKEQDENSNEESELVQQNYEEEEKQNEHGRQEEFTEGGERPKKQNENVMEESRNIQQDHKKNEEQGELHEQVEVAEKKDENVPSQDEEGSDELIEPMETNARSQNEVNQQVFKARSHPEESVENSREETEIVDIADSLIEEEDVGKLIEEVQIEQERSSDSSGEPLEQLEAVQEKSSQIIDSGVKDSGIQADERMKSNEGLEQDVVKDQEENATLIKENDEVPGGIHEQNIIESQARENEDIEPDKQFDDYVLEAPTIEKSVHTKVEMQSSDDTVISAVPEPIMDTDTLDEVTNVEAIANHETNSINSDLRTGELFENDNEAVQLDSQHGGKNIEEGVQPISSDDYIGREALQKIVEKEEHDESNQQGGPEETSEDFQENGNFLKNDHIEPSAYNPASEEYRPNVSEIAQEDNVLPMETKESQERETEKDVSADMQETLNHDSVIDIEHDEL